MPVYESDSGKEMSKLCFFTFMFLVNLYCLQPISIEHLSRCPLLSLFFGWPEHFS